MRLAKSVSNEEIGEHLRILKDQYPFFFEELRGVSHSTHIPIDRLVALQWFFFSQVGGACTTTLSTGNATKYNETFLTQNYDTTMDFNEFPLLSMISTYIVLNYCHLVRYNTLRYRYAYWGIPVLYEVPAINEMGLGFGGNGLRLTQNESRPVDEGPGMATYMLERLTMMTCKNVSEVAFLWKNTERASRRDQGYDSYPNFWDNSITMWCDREGGILCIEQMHSSILCVFGNMSGMTQEAEGILWHANHHQWLDANLTGSVLPDEGFLGKQTYLRAVRARQLLEDHYGNITLDVCMNITRDHSGGTDPFGKDSCDICTHPDQEYLARTSFSWIIIPQKYTVYWAHGPPCRHQFHSQNFTDCFVGEV